MKIYYFSGTGNSYYAAKKIQMNFPESTIESIADLINNNDIQVNDSKLVIICPIYFYGMPHIVKEFIEHLNFDEVKYFSFIFTAEYPNGLAMGMLKEICKRKNVNLNSCFYLQMPTNYLIKSRMLKSDGIEKVLNKSEKKLSRIIGIIKTEKNHLEKDSRLYSAIVNAKHQYSNWEKTFPVFDSKFTVNDNCNGCRLCEKYCPVVNIKFEEKPVWNNHCEACLKCINICPQQAIQYDNKTDGRLRYFNPEVKIHEFK